MEVLMPCHVQPDDCQNISLRRDDDGAAFVAGHSRMIDIIAVPSWSVIALYVRVDR